MRTGLHFESVRYKGNVRRSFFEGGEPGYFLARFGIKRQTGFCRAEESFRG